MPVAAFAVEQDVTAPSDVEKVFMYRIVISPLRFPQELSHVPENLSVLDADAIETLPANDPAEALTHVSGVNISPRGGFGHTTPLSIHGSESRHVLVMLDGIPFNTQASGQADILPSLPLGGLDRIEVIKGSASSAWGSSLGGVVHLITKAPSASSVPKGKATTSFSEFRQQRHAVELTGSAGKLGYLLSGEYREAAGARTHTGTQNRDDTLGKKGFGKLVYPVSEAITATGLFGYSGDDINEGIYSDTTRQHLPYYARYALFRIDVDPDERRHWEAALKMNRQLISVDTLDGTSESLFSNVRTQDHYYGVELKHVARFRLEDTLAAGVDLSEHILKSSQLRESRSIASAAPYANYTWVTDPFDWVLGARYDLNEEYGDQLNPKVGAVYHVPGAKDTLIRADVSRSFSAPPLLWRFFENVSPGVTANNPDLKPERAWTYELGLETQPTESLWFKFDAYRSDIGDAIATIERNGLFIKDNFDKFRQEGFELESRLKLPGKLSLYFSADFNDVKNRSTGADVTNRGVTRPGYRLGLEGEAPCGLRFNILGRYQRWDTTASLRPNDRTFIFDAHFSKTLTTLRGVEVGSFLNIYNLTNSKYWSIIDYPLPERYFEGGVTLEF